MLTLMCLHWSVQVLTSLLDFYLFEVLRRVQQPGSYGDGQFTGGGNQCTLHCKPPGISK